MKFKKNQMFSLALLGLFIMLAVGCTDSDDNTANNDSESADSGDTGTATDNDTGPDSQTETETFPDTDSGTESDSNSDSETGSDSASDTESELSTDSDSATGSDSDSSPDTDTDTDTDSTTESDSGTHTDSDTSSDTTIDTGTDTDSDSDSETDTASDTDTESDTDNPNPWGFTVSNPGTHTLYCDDPADIFDGDVEESDRHWLCTFKEGDAEGVLYIQAIPVECVVMMSPLINYNIGVAEIYIDNDIHQLEDASYDYGGNHRNDSLGFTYNNRKYHYDHSSYGLGYRSCQNMDCANISDMNDDVVENGCTCDRTHPIVCVKQAADGSFPPLVDTFEVCETDPDCGD